MCVCLCTGTAFFACVWGKEPLLFSPDPCLQGAARGNYFPLRRKRFTTLRQREMTVALSLPYPLEYHAAEHCRGSTWPGSPAWHALQAQRQEAETGVGNGSVELGRGGDIPDGHAEGRDGGTAVRGACEGR